MKNKNYSNLLKHTFWGNIDSGVIMIFMSFYLWNKSGNMLIMAFAFMIPILINTVVDYYFSHISDKSNRKKLIIIGNIGSSIFLTCYGFADNIFVLYIFIFFKSVFAKLYQSSLAPYKRELIDEDKYKKYISKENIKISVGSSLGGFSLMALYGYINSIPLIFIVSGLVELYSTVYLFRLEDIESEQKKDKEEVVDLKFLKEITVIYTIEAFAIALLSNRIMIFLSDYHKLDVFHIGLVFFIVYGISTMISARVYGKFKILSLKKILIISLLCRVILLISFTRIAEIKLLILLWFAYRLIANVKGIYLSDRVNKSLFTDVGKRLSKLRICITLGTIAGQIVISSIWDRVGMSESFYFSSIVLFVLAIIIGLRENLEDRKELM